MQLALNEKAHEEMIQRALPEARRFVWIATADLKDMHLRRGRRYVSILVLLAELIGRGVEVRLLHAKEPGPRFRADFDRHPEFLTSERFERLLCPRNHMKTIIVDGKIAYVGSANLTGAGLGAKKDNRRNFEAGIITRERASVSGIMDAFDAIFMGEHCAGCGRRDVCPDPIL